MIRRRVLVGIAVGVACACGPRTPDLAYRGWTDHFAFRVSADPAPPHAREKTLYKVVVRDKDSGQPIQGGEGRIYGTNADRVTTWDSFTAGPELGTYYATLRFVTAGDWAMALEFRRDSTQKLEKIEWRQEVGAERPATH